MTLMLWALLLTVVAVSAEDRDLQLVRSGPLCNALEDAFIEDVTCECDRFILDQTVGFRCQYDDPICREGLVTRDGERGRFCAEPSLGATILIQPLVFRTITTVDLCFNDMEIKYSGKSGSGSGSRSKSGSKGKGGRRRKVQEEPAEGDLGTLCAAVDVQVANEGISVRSCTLSYDEYDCSSCVPCVTLGGDVGIQINCDNFATERCLPLPLPSLFRSAPEHRVPMEIPELYFPETEPDSMEEVEEEVDIPVITARNRVRSPLGGTRANKIKKKNGS